ncbi:MAG TPA: tRNA preQ1(34) S-adenosylmethionine ribosyltransferase-isomerase QueA [Candidatus Polarisedimenticolia bacterium]|nr:tRNA preQ1(34) S-adenosylmethionine ribosyltransferase-isomerase QueA [Candidatus Polarisedimenticolia bacterium]
MREDETRLEYYDYLLPEHAIAQEPASPRDASRLLVLDRAAGTSRHLQFADLPDLMSERDLLVLNDTRVFPARLRGRKPTGGAVEFLLTRPLGDGCWEALCNATRELRRGARIEFPGLAAEIEGRQGEGIVLRFPGEAEVESLLERSGEMPLPPYIRRPAGEVDGAFDRERYQTIYARQRGAVAAPTAGLHFTHELLARLETQGVRRCFVTLHVGPGTFLPVRVDDARQHRVLPEPFVLSDATLQAIDATRRRGGRVVAVGTTVARVLEHAALRGIRQGAEGECDLTILPGHRFLNVDALITNFHLPRSTLLLLVAAFAGRERILAAYEDALERGYRFYSYGDAMLIL